MKIPGWLSGQTSARPLGPDSPLNTDGARLVVGALVLALAAFAGYMAFAPGEPAPLYRNTSAGRLPLPAPLSNWEQERGPPSAASTSAGQDAASTLSPPIELQVECPAESRLGTDAICIKVPPSQGMYGRDRDILVVSPGEQAARWVEPDRQSVEAEPLGRTEARRAQPSGERLRTRRNSQ